MEFNFTRLDLLLTVPADAIPPALSPDEEAISQLSRALHRALLDSSVQFNCEVRVEHGRSLKLMWIAAGQTAGVGYWMNGQHVECISLLLSGVDLVEDLGALQIVLAAVPPALPQPAVDAILQTHRPLLACLYSRPDLLNDRTICTGTAALAIAFFGMLGIGVESEIKPVE